MEPANIGAHIYTDDVAFLQDLVAGDPVDDLVVHRNAGSPREVPHPRRAGEVQERGDGPLPFDEFANCSIYLKSGYAGTYHFARQRTGRRSNLSRTAHPLNISGRL